MFQPVRTYGETAMTRPLRTTLARTTICLALALAGVALTLPTTEARTGRAAADTTAPVATTIGGAVSATLSTRVPLKYRATDSGSGVAYYDVRLVKGGYGKAIGAWTRPAAYQHLTTTSVQSPSISLGQTLCFSVRAADKAHNLGAWSARRCITRALDDTAATGASGWTTRSRTDFYRGSARVTSKQGATLRFGAQSSRYLGVVAQTCSSCGRVGIYASGELIGTIDLRSATTRNRQYKYLLVGGTGPVAVKVLSSGRHVVIDGLLSLR